ncbi:MAG: hypothetical protein E6G80_04595 [Alphaproteobacteria bacterium]|nr:MAG: hypothetical protein E6G80_04595 [Alphaproteobacteria bacterium]
MCSAGASRAALAHLGRFVLQDQEPGAPDWEGEPRTVCLGSRWWAAMKSSWTPSRDKRLLSLQAAGRTAAEIAKSMGISRNAVIGRSRRLRGIVYRSDIESWARANARRSQEAKKRMKARQKAQREALRELTRAVRRGVPTGKAMARAHRAGALWRQIGHRFGISQQAAYEKAKVWTQRHRF